MLFDSHIHTEISTDSKMNIEDALFTAEKFGVGLVLTEHYDHGMIEGSFIFDTKEYFSKYTPFRSDRLLLGIELGLTKEAFDINRGIYDENPFDFVLGSVHMTDGKDIYNDIKDNAPPSITPEKYLKANIDMVNMYPYIDSLAHIDYYSRYLTKDDKYILYNDYKDLYDELFVSLNTNNTVIEVNSSEIDKPDNLENFYNMFSAYRNAGNSYVTIGSDAHKTSSICRNFSLALKLISDIGLKPVYFKNREMIICSESDYVGLF